MKVVKVIAVADGRFNRIRQVSPMCPPMRAHWRHLANTIELVLPSAHPSPQSKRQIDRFNHFCTSSRQSVVGHARACPFPGRVALEIWAPAAGPLESVTQTASRSVQPFCTDHGTVLLYFTTGRPSPSLKITPSRGKSGPHLKPCI